MQEQDIKKGQIKNLEGGKLKTLLEDFFNKVETDGEKYIVHYGALSPLAVWIKDKSTLCVDTKMNADVTEEIAIDTRKRYNQFLDRATGFTSKQRRERLMKKVKEGEP